MAVERTKEKEQEGVDRREEKNIAEVIYPARCVEGAEDAIFAAPGKDVAANTSILGQKPTHLKGPEAESFLNDKIYKSIFSPPYF